VVSAYRQNAAKFLGYDPRRQFVHEDDVASAFVQAAQIDMPGAFNVVPDDYMRLYEVWDVVGKKFVPTIPLWLARLTTDLKWRYFGSPVHASWVEDMLVDFTGSNAKLRKTGWKPRYGSLQALQSAL
jgi:nucleoside-diphosphate-sugar epimerase